MRNEVKIISVTNLTEKIDKVVEDLLNDGWRLLTTLPFDKNVKLVFVKQFNR